MPFSTKNLNRFNYAAAALDTETLLDYEARIDTIMDHVVPEKVQYRWCRATVCACLGCVHSFAGKDITEADWIGWVKRHDRRSGKDRRDDER